MIVTPSLHEACLQNLVKQLDRRGLDQSAGIHGPASVAWRVNAEIVNFLGAGRAILLQLAHPFVAHAIAEHSVALTDPHQRFQRTFDNIYRMTFGPRAEALESARLIHRVHTRVHGRIGEDAGRHRAGDRYWGNDAAALLWVHSTLIDTALQVHRLAGLQLSPRDERLFYEDSKRFSLLFGLDDQLVPGTLASFREYVGASLRGDELAVTAPAREIGRAILQAPSRALEPLFRVYRAVTSALLPDSLRRAYGLPFGVSERLTARATLQLVARTRAALPVSLRWMPAAIRAEARLGLRPVTGLSRLVERSLERGLGLWSPADRPQPMARSSSASP